MNISALTSWWNSPSAAKQDLSESARAADLFVADLQERHVKLSTQLECAECGVVDDSSRELDCQHSPFCLTCLKKNECVGKVICPCSNVTVFGSRAVEDLPVSVRRIKRLEWSRSNGIEISSIRSPDGSFYSKTTYVKDEDAEFDYVLLGSSGKLKSPSFTKYLPFSLADAPARRLMLEWLKSHYFSPSDLDFTIEAITDYVGDIPRQEDIESSTFGGVLHSIRSYYQSIQTYKTVAGKRKSRHEKVLQVATASLSHGLVSQLLSKKGAFTYVERSCEPDLKPFDQESVGDVPVLDVDVSDQEAWDLRQPCVSRLEMVTCCEELRHTHQVTEVKDFEAFIRFVNRSHTLVLLPIYAAVFQYSDRFFEVLCSGYRASYIVGDRPGYGAGLLGRIPSLALSFLKEKF